MISMGDHFDTALLHRFIRVTGFYPVGSYVELQGGDVAVVEAQTDDLAHPVLEVQGRFEQRGEEKVYERCEAIRLDPAKDPDAFHILRGFEKDPEDVLPEQTAA